ncbi:protein disulfide oxidoreductase [Thiohalophilus thiocyanatoxydans]|uniref:Thiol-disulfide isomerase/thioredoxin n=1 Tax=Thiohalophilus thiocyanatoxydans TaxID=381308 RepID=A0A4R8IJY4_9GAMM|nr:protein disulfide oxidoreductase [Thiohalophilus thiocyanatoxydans]TDY01052.1 thiol-disulfide isomerase/thioredoxin [Thiohalophilus thiocyanatoxydans]
MPAAKLPKPVRFLLWVLIFAMVYFGAQQYQKRNLVSGTVPEYIAPMLQGAEFDSRDIEGKPYILHFWASWCPICRFEQDTIQALSRDHQVISVAMQSGDRTEVQAYMREHSLNFMTLLDEEGLLARRFGIKGVPTTLLVNSEGEIVFREIGYSTEWGLRLRMWLVD